jgi:hypothetical protein
MFSIFGSQILGMFLVSGILRMIIARLMLPKLSLHGIPDAIIHPELAMELAAVPVPARMGLYYYPDAWRRFTHRTVSAGSNVIGKAFSTITLSQNGLFYKPAKWAEYMSRAGAQPETMEAKDTSQSVRDNLFHKPGKWLEYLTGIGAQPAVLGTDVTPQPVRDGLYYHREGWSSFQEQQAPEHPSKTNRQSVNRSGLFHNPQRWGDYMKQSLALNATTMRTGGEGITLRQPVFYHPEMWEKYQQETADSKIIARAKAPASREALLYHPDDWQKYSVQSATRKNRRTSPQIGATITAAMTAHSSRAISSTPIRRIRTTAALA